MTPLEGLGTEELASRWGAPECLWRDQVTSTLDLVHARAETGGPAGLVVLAEAQTRGRGRQGARWHSPPGRGVWLGVLLRPEEPVSGGVTALRAGLAVIAALDGVGVGGGGGAQAQVKWPNDIVLDDRKMGGILCEARWRGDAVGWIAVGVGLNIHGPVPEEVRGRAVALDELVPGVTRLAVLDRLVPALLRLPVHETLLDEEREIFRDRDWLAGKALTEPIVGIARGIGPDGTLLVETEEGMRNVVGGTVVTA